MESTGKGKAARRLGAALAVLFCLLASGFLAAIGSARINRRQAAGCLQDALKLKVGDSSSDDVKRMAQRYARYLTTYPPDCEPQECEVSFAFENTWLARLGLAPRTVFLLRVRVSKGAVEYLHAEFEDLEGSQLVYEAHVTELLKQPAGEREAFEVARLNRGQVVVFLTRDATTEQQQRAFGFNFDCFSRLGGCKNTRGHLPAMWEYYANQLPD